MRGVYQSSRTIARVVLAASVMFGCSATMAEGPRSNTAAPTEKVTYGMEEAAVERNGTKQIRNSQPQTNPIELDSRLREISSGLRGDSRTIVNQLFERLHRGAQNGVIVRDMNGLQPRTASEALAQGGDCTDLANIAIALLREKNVPGGAMVVHFDSSPANLEHMVPYVERDGRRVIVDLQTQTLGQTAAGRYSVVMTMTYDQAASMYHREMGDYLRDHNQPDQAIVSYRRAISIFDGDAYAHQNLGILLERSGNMTEASQHFQRATEIDPRYRREQRRGNYNQELQAAQQAMDAGRWADCARHLQAALSSGEQINPGDHTTIEQNLRACNQRAGQ